DQAIASVQGQANSPLTFAGDTGDDFDRKLGQTVTIEGGEDSDLTDNNIGVVSNDKDTLTVKLAKNLTLGDENGAGSIEFGTTDSQGDIDTSKPHSALDDGGLDVADDQGNEAHYGADQAKIADADGNSTTIHSTDIV